MKVRFFVQLVPEWYDGSDPHSGLRSVYGVAAKRLSLRQPADPLPGAVVVPIVLDVDPELFGAIPPITGSVGKAPSGEVRISRNQG